MNFDIAAITSFTIKVLILITAIPLHELAHGYTAYLLGDTTAKNQGRLTLNPIKHIDPVGALMMLFAGFGWAKPVPVSTHRIKNVKLGMVLISLAGPMANLMLALLFMTFTKIFGFHMPALYSLSADVWYFIFDILFGMCTVNITLAVFNMFPIPPLDGSKILFSCLPMKWYHLMLQYQRQITLLTCFLLFSGILSTPISFVTQKTLLALDQFTAVLGILF